MDSIALDDGRTRTFTEIGGIHVEFGVGVTAGHDNLVICSVKHRCATSQLNP